jgi:hypothetical protein
MKKKVRIAIAIDHTGAWSCSGWGGAGRDPKESDMMSFAIETLENGEKQYFIEAELDIPEIKTIEPISVLAVATPE